MEAKKTKQRKKTQRKGTYRKQGRRPSAVNDFSGLIRERSDVSNYRDKCSRVTRSQMDQEAPTLEPPCPTRLPLPSGEDSSSSEEEAEDTQNVQGYTESKIENDCFY